MAKRKNSTALFEVMRAAQQKSLQRQGASVQTSAAPAEPSRGSPPTVRSAAPRAEPPRSYAPSAGQSQLKPLGTPAIVTVTKKWLSSLLEKKPRTDADPVATAALDPDDPTAGITAQSLASRATRPAPKTISAAKPIAAERYAAAEPAGEQAFVDETEPQDDLPPIAPARHVAPRPVAPEATRPVAQPASTQVAIDRDRQEVTVKVRFQTVIIGLVAALSVIGLAYIVGKKAGVPAARQPSTPEIRNGAAQPGVLDPRGDAGMASGRVPGEASARISPAPNAGTTVRTAVGFQDAPVRDGLATRSVELNYCVIQSYTAEQQQWALDVRDYLNSRNIPCTIEIGRRNLATRSGDYIIVGTRGFEPGFGSSPAYKQYELAIEQAGRSFPEKSKFNIPQTMWVKWFAE